MVTNKNISSFDDITEDNRLWAVRYEGDEDKSWIFYLPNGMTCSGFVPFLRTICLTCNDTSISQMLM
jgi:hypothetical protein